LPLNPSLGRCVLNIVNVVLLEVWMVEEVERFPEKFRLFGSLSLNVRATLKSITPAPARGTR